MTDYNKICEKERNYLMNDPNISDINKQYVQEYEEVHKVKPSTWGIFYRHIRYFFAHTDDCKDLLEDKKRINKIFKALGEAHGAATWNKILQVTIDLMKYLNNGVRPISFADQKPISNKKIKRDLNADDMISWEEGVKMAEGTTSVQLKAIILTQLDAGLRPSEFINLKYGDIKLKKDIGVIEVREGKTGARDAPIMHCIPYLLKWRQAHPTKKDSDPLWVMENAEKSRVKQSDGTYKQTKKKIRQVLPYKYDAIRRRIFKLGAKTGLKKPLDFYNFRHSACTLAKKDNVPLDEAAEKFGHSVEYFVSTYGRLDREDQLNRWRKHYKLEESEREERPHNRICTRCQNNNEPDADLCQNCGKPLTLGKALENEQEAENRIKELNDRLKKMESQQGTLANIAALLADPERQEALKELLVKQ